MSTDYNINFTVNALKKIHSLIKYEEETIFILRIAVSGGGCSGFKYDFLIDQISKNVLKKRNSYKKNKNSNFIFEKDTNNIIIKDKNENPILIIDNYSAKFLNNSLIDYIEDLTGSRFQIKNTIVKSKCGCGNSFSI